MQLHKATNCQTTLRAVWQDYAGSEQFIDQPDGYLHQQIEATGFSDSPSKIATLSSGEFVGMVTDDPDSHGAGEDQRHSPKNYEQILEGIEDLVNTEMKRIMGDPGSAGAALQKNEEDLAGIN